MELRQAVKLPLFQQQSDSSVEQQQALYIMYMSYDMEGGVNTMTSMLSKLNFVCCD